MTPTAYFLVRCLLGDVSRTLPSRQPRRQHRVSFRLGARASVGNYLVRASGICACCIPRQYPRMIRWDRSERSAANGRQRNRGAGERWRLLHGRAGLILGALVAALCSPVKAPLTCVPATTGRGIWRARKCSRFTKTSGIDDFFRESIGRALAESVQPLVMCRCRRLMS